MSEQFPQTNTERNNQANPEIQIGATAYPSKEIPDTLLTSEVQNALSNEALESFEDESSAKRAGVEQHLGKLGLGQFDNFGEESKFHIPPMTKQK